MDLALWLSEATPHADLSRWKAALWYGLLFQGASKELYPSLRRARGCSYLSKARQPEFSEGTVRDMSRCADRRGFNYYR